MTGVENSDKSTHFTPVVLLYQRIEQKSKRMAYRFGKSTEDICISKIKGGIRGIKNGTKTPEEAKCGFFLKKLKPLNEGMHSDLMAEYVEVWKEWEKKQDD